MYINEIEVKDLHRIKSIIETIENDLHIAFSKDYKEVIRIERSNKVREYLLIVNELLEDVLEQIST